MSDLLECDCVIGTITHRDDYEYYPIDFKMSESGDVLIQSAWVLDFKKDSMHYFTPHNFCHDCGRFVQPLSAEVAKRLA